MTKAQSTLAIAAAIVLVSSRSTTALSLVPKPRPHETQITALRRPAFRCRQSRSLSQLPATTIEDGSTAEEAESVRNDRLKAADEVAKKLKAADSTKSYKEETEPFFLDDDGKKWPINPSDNKEPLLPKPPTDTPPPPNSKPVVVSKIDEGPSMLDKFLAPLLNPTIAKNVPSQMIQGAFLSGAFVTLLSSFFVFGPLSISSLATLVIAANVGVITAYISITEGMAGDFLRSLGSATIEVTDSLFNSATKEKKVRVLTKEEEEKAAKYAAYNEKKAAELKAVADKKTAEEEKLKKAGEKAAAEAKKAQQEKIAADAEALRIAKEKKLAEEKAAVEAEELRRIEQAKAEDEARKLKEEAKEAEKAAVEAKQAEIEREKEGRMLEEQAEAAREAVRLEEEAEQKRLAEQAEAAREAVRLMEEQDALMDDDDEDIDELDDEDWEASVKLANELQGTSAIGGDVMEDISDDLLQYEIDNLTPEEEDALGKAARAAVAKYEEELRLQDMTMEEVAAPPSPAPKPAKKKKTRKAKEDTPAPAGDSVDYSKMTVAQLKDVLRSKNLKLSGKKAELIERLNESS